MHKHKNKNQNKNKKNKKNICIRIRMNKHARESQNVTKHGYEDKQKDSDKKGCV